MKTADYLILAAVAIWFCLALRSIIKKRGGCGCAQPSGSCGTCGLCKSAGGTAENAPCCMGDGAGCRGGKCCCPSGACAAGGRQRNREVCRKKIQEDRNGN